MKTAKYETMRQVVSVFSLQSDFSLCIYKYKSYCTESLKIDFLQKHICCKSMLTAKECVFRSEAYVLPSQVYVLLDFRIRQII